MLLHIKRPLSGSIDGVDLTRFDAGRVYSLPTEIATFLLAVDAAEPAADDALVASPSSQSLFGQTDTRDANARWKGPERRQTPR